MKILKKSLLLLMSLLPISSSYSVDITVRGSDGRLYQYINLNHSFLSKQKTFSLSSTTGYFLTKEGARIYFKNSDGSSITKNGYLNLTDNYVISSQAFTPDSYDRSSNNKNVATNFSAPAPQDKFWPGGHVNYKFDESSDFTQAEIDLIENALNEISRHTNGLTFAFYSGRYKSCDSDGKCWLGRTNDLKPNDGNFIRFKKTYSDTCNSLVGMQIGGQDINLNVKLNCINTTTVIHEVMHALGFHHEQSRYDRDQYIIINWDSIPESWRSNYDKLEEFSTRFGQYDYNSIMHYPSGYHEGQNKCNLTNINGEYILKNKLLSQLDIDGLKRAYPPR